MALLHLNLTNKHLPPSPSLYSTRFFYFNKPKPSQFLVPSFSTTTNQQNSDDEEASKSNKLSQQSSWEAKDSEGNDYLYRLGKESDNMNIAVGARAGVIDDLFTGKFLGTDGNSKYFLMLLLLLLLVIFITN